MKKILIILLCVCSLNANATEMCARDDTVVVPLDATIGTTVNQKTHNPVEWIWWADFDYGRVYGNATCLSVSEIRELENKPDLKAYPNSLTTGDDKLLGRYDWYNNDSSNASNERKACYCKLSHPMDSLWTYYRAVNVSICKTGCYNECAMAVQVDFDFRSRLYDNVGR